MITINQLNQIRKDKKVSYKKLAKSIGLSATQTANILTGTSEMSVKHLINICNELEIGLSFTYI